MKFLKITVFSLIVFLICGISYGKVKLWQNGVESQPEIKVFYVDSEKSVEEQLRDNVYEQIDKLDITLFDSFVLSLDEDTYKVFGNRSFLETVKSMLNGEFDAGLENLFGIILNMFFSYFLGFLPVLITIIIISILSSLLLNLKSEFLGKNVGDIIHFVCYLAIILILAASIYQIIALTVSTINNMRNFMNMVFPVILTLMAASGGTSSSSLLQPLTAILSSGITEIIVGLIIPIFLVMTVLTVVSNLSSNIKLTRLAGFFKSFAQWVIGICFTVFIAFLAIQGILSGATDGISIRAAKYAIGHSIPIVGGYLKDGFNLVLGSCVLIKNAVGVTGMLLVLGMVLVPVVQMLVFSLGLKLTSGIVEPVTDKRMSTMIHDLSKNITLLLVAVISVAFMFFLTLAVLILSSNSVLI